jgi:Peptide chain release factor 1 (eRF1)
MLINIGDIDVKELSRIYDSENRDSFISLYLNLDNLDNRLIERRKNACRLALKLDRELLANFEKTIQVIDKYLETERREKGQKAMILFASCLNDFFRAYKTSISANNLLVVDTSPYIRPIARLMDEYETFGLIFLDSHRAKIYVVSSGKVEYEKKTAKDIMNKHKKGGWSQARFQRLREGAIEHFYKNVSADAIKLFSQDNVVKIVIAGPGNAKLAFKNFLPNELKEKVIDLIDVEFDDAKGKLVSDVVNIVSENEQKTSDENVSKLNDEILRDGLAVYGLKETIDAVRNGQVELLLISKGLKVKGWICERCQAVERGVKTKCPYCGSKTSEVDIVEEIIEFAKRTDTKIEFVADNPVLDKLGGVGGLLRFH